MQGIALQAIDTELADHFHFVIVFNGFGNDQNVLGVSHVHKQFNKLLVVPVGVDVPDETAVDFQINRFQTAKRTQCSDVSAEMVDTDARS